MCSQIHFAIWAAQFVPEALQRISPSNSSQELLCPNDKTEHVMQWQVTGPGILEENYSFGVLAQWKSWIMLNEVEWSWMMLNDVECKTTRYYKCNDKMQQCQKQNWELLEGLKFGEVMNATSADIGVSRTFGAMASIEHLLVMTL